MKYLHLNVDEIDLDYSYSFENINGDLTYIKFFDGEWIYPPIFVIKKVKYTLIEGLKRFLFLKNKGLKKIKVLNYFNLSEENQLIRAILHRQIFYPLSLIEKSQIIFIFKKNIQLKDSYLVDLLSQIEENVSTHLLDSFYQISFLDLIVKNYIEKNKIGLKLALRFCNYGVEDQKILVEYLEKLKLNINYTRIFLDFLDFFCFKRKSNLKNFLLSLNSLKYLLDKKSSIFIQKKLFDELNNLKYPSYQRQINKIKTQIRIFNLKARWKIIIPNNLEGEGFEFKLSIRNEKEYIQMLNKFKELLENNSIKELFKLL